MLDQLTVSDFQAVVGSRFLLQLGKAGSLGLELLEAEILGSPPAEPRRHAFSLLFRGPLEPELFQSIYALTHETLGSLEIFLVPINRKQDGFYYEAVFT